MAVEDQHVSPLGPSVILLTNKQYRGDFHKLAFSLLSESGQVCAPVCMTEQAGGFGLELLSTSAHS